MMSGSRRSAISFYRRFCPVPLADQEVTLAETHPEKRLIGYARVSTYGQTLDTQLGQAQVALLDVGFCPTRPVYSAGSSSPGGLSGSSVSV